MSGENGLRVGGWVAASEETSDDAAVLDPAMEDPSVIDAEPVGTVTEAWQPAEIPDPAAGAAGDDDAGAYRGRRRLIGPRMSPSRLRRVAVAAVAAGALLVGVSAVVAGLVLAGGEPRLAPPASPEVAEPDAGREGPVVDPTESGSASPTPSPTEPPVQSFFEAEAAELGAHAQVSGFDGAAGGEVVRLTGNRSGAFVRFTDIVVVDSGQYEIAVGYFSEQDRAGAVSVNDGPPLAVTFPSRGEDGGVGSITVPVALGSGSNTILVSSGGGPPLSIDGIVVSG